MLLHILNIRFWPVFVFHFVSSFGKGVVGHRESGTAVGVHSSRKGGVGVSNKNKETDFI